MEIKDIQKILDEMAAKEKTLSKRQIVNQITNGNRKDDEDYKDTMKRINNNRSQEWKDNLAANKHKIYESAGFKASRQKMAQERSKPVVTPYGEFKSQQEFKRITGLAWTNKIKVYPHLYYNKEDGPGVAPTEKVYYTPYGYHYKKIEVLRMAKNNGMFTDVDETRASDWFKQISRNNTDQYYVKTEPKREWNLEK